MDEPGQMAQPTISLTGNALSLSDIEKVARHHARVEISTSVLNTIQDSADSIAHLADSSQPIYGVNTGFGIFANKRIDPEQTTEISRNLIRSHAVALGNPLPEDITRAAMLIRANTLSRGHSGVRPQIIQTLLEMLNEDVTPIVPSQGSLGSSGDLALLAHLVLVLANVTDETQDSQSGLAQFKGQIMSGVDAMEAAGISRVVLGPKEGLALTNGATFSAGIVALSLMDAKRLLFSTEIATAMTFDALQGVLGALDPRIHEVRLHPGQINTARRIRNYLEGSTLVGSSNKVQDAYSLRCTPQIVGPTWEALDFANALISRQINAVTDNPLLFDHEVLSGGNFHGQPIGMVADFMKIALTEVCNLSERRTYRLLAAHTNEGLPPMLISDPGKVGLYSGLMMLQYTAASLCLENQALSTPSSTKSIPTSAGQEDHNANSATAARHLADIVANMHAIVAIELLCASQALEIRLAEKPQLTAGKTTLRTLECIRSVSPFVNTERPMAEDIKAVADLISSGSLLKYVDVSEAML
jgi:histidine ammonia-lyase